VFAQSFAGPGGERLLDDSLQAVAANTALAPAERSALTRLLASVRDWQKLAPDAAGGAGARGPSFEPPYTFVEREATAPGGARRYDGYAHSFGGMSVQFVLFVGVELGVGLLLARRLGLWARLRAAPLGRATLLGSYLTSATLIAFVLVLAIFAVGMAAFGVRIQGSVAGFVGVVAAFALLTASFGLLLAALGGSPETTRGLAIFATLLMVMLGGAWVPTFVFPDWLQQLTVAIPLRWAVDGLDAMTWRGLPASAALRPIAMLLAFSALFAGVALWRFRWRE
jgi:ABC-2 type transport system permease protein